MFTFNRILPMRFLQTSREFLTQFYFYRLEYLFVVDSFRESIDFRKALFKLPNGEVIQE